MYNCTLTNDSNDTFIYFQLFEADTNIVMVIKSTKSGGNETTATGHEEADILKENYISQGFKEI